MGKTAVLRCNASGIPEPDIDWIKDHGGIDKRRIRQLANGNLFIRDVHMSDAGQYSCIASTAEELKEIKVALQVVGMTQTFVLTCEPCSMHFSFCFLEDITKCKHFATTYMKRSQNFRTTVIRDGCEAVKALSFATSFPNTEKSVYCFYKTILKNCVYILPSKEATSSVYRHLCATWEKLLFVTQCLLLVALCQKTLNVFRLLCSLVLSTIFLISVMLRERRHKTKPFSQA